MPIYINSMNDIRRIMSKAYESVDHLQYNVEFWEDLVDEGSIGLLNHLEEQGFKYGDNFEKYEWEPFEYIKNL